MDLATYNANKPPTSQVHKTLPGVPLDGALVSGTPSLTGEAMSVEKSKVVSLETSDVIGSSRLCSPFATITAACNVTKQLGRFTNSRLNSKRKGENLVRRLRWGNL